MRGILHWCAAILGTVALLVAAVALALRFWPSSQVPILAVTSVSPIVLGISVVVALTCLASIRAFWRLGVAALLAVAGVWLQAPYFVAVGGAVDDPITVLTSNVMFGRADVDALARLTRDQAVDVLAVQELTPQEADAIAKSPIAEQLPYSFVRADADAQGTAIYSRFPLAEQTEYPGFVFNQVSVVVTVPGHGVVQVFAVHPVPPTLTSRWDRELEQIDTLIHDVPADRRVVAMGDFNATGDHAIFRRLLDGGYRDAGEVAGAGWLPTYPTDKSYPPIVGIDHVLVRGLSAVDTSAHDLAGTDHRAVSALVG